MTPAYWTVGEDAAPWLARRERLRRAEMFCWRALWLVTWLSGFTVGVIVGGGR